MKYYIQCQMTVDLNQLMRQRALDLDDVDDEGLILAEVEDELVQSLVHSGINLDEIEIIGSD